MKYGVTLPSCQLHDIEVVKIKIDIFLRNSIIFPY